MKIKRKLVKNTGFVLIAGIVSKLFSFFFIAYAARVLGPVDFGFYGLIGAMALLFFYFGNFGVSQMAVREISRDRAKAETIFNHILSLRMSLAIISYTILVFIVSFMGYRDDIKHLIYISGLNAIFLTFSSSFGVLYMAFERFKVPSLISMLVSFSSTASSVIILYLGFGLKGVVWITFLGSFSGALLSGVWVRKRFIKYRFSFNFSLWKDLVSQSIPFAVFSFLQQANSYINILFLSKLPGPLPGELSIGYYNPASSLCKAAMMLPDSFKKAALPTIASNSGNNQMIRKLISRSTNVLLIAIVLPLILLTTFFPKEIIKLVFGASYLPSALALTILGWAYALQVFNAPVTVTLSASKEINRFIPWVMLTFGVNLVLGIPLIMYYGFIGASIAFLASRVVDTMVRNYLLQSIWGIKRWEL